MTSLLFLSLLFAPGMAFAAAQPEPTGAQESIGQEPAVRSEQSERLRAAADEAAARKQVEGDKVAYDQVLKDPDNVDLNYRYARSQIAAGELKGAAATLERILLVNPSLQRVRLLYALVLYRLDNLAEAERELNTLSALTLPGSLRSELDEYRAAIAKRRRSTHVDVMVGFGFDYDTNRAAGPSSGLLLFNTVLIPQNPPNPKNGDTAMIGLGSVRVTHDPGTQNGHEVFAGFDWYRAEQTVQDKLDLQAFGGNLGTTLKFGRNQYTPKVNYDHVYLHQRKYLERPAISFRYDRKVTDRFGASFEARMAGDEYVKTPDIPTAEERSGHQWDLAWGLSYVLSPTVRVQGGYTLIGKEAEKLYNAYDRHSVNAAVAFLLGRGMFLLTSGVMNIDRYDGPDPMVSPRVVRDDITYRARVTFGTPLSFVHASLKDLVLTGTYEYFYADSNLTNFLYDNNKFSSLMTYKWSL